MFKNDYSSPNYTSFENTGHDYILRLIEQLAAYLWAIVFNKKAQNYDVAIEKIEEAYNGLLFKNGNEIKKLSTVEIILNNTNKNVLEKDNIEIIANLLYEEAEIIELKNGQNNLSLDYYSKSLNLFVLLLNETETQKYYKNIDTIISKLEYYDIDDSIKMVYINIIFKVVFLEKLKIYCINYWKIIILKLLKK